MHQVPWNTRQRFKAPTRAALFLVSLLQLATCLQVRQQIEQEKKEVLQKDPEWFGMRDWTSRAFSLLLYVLFCEEVT